MLSTLRESLQIAVDEKEEISSELELVQSNHTKLQAEVLELKQRIAALEGNNERLKVEKSELEKTKLALDTELDAMRTELKGIQTKHSALTEQKKEWFRELGSDEKVQEVYQEALCLKELNAGLEKEADRVRAEHSELMGKYKGLEYANAQLQQEVDRTKTDRDRLMEEVEELRDEVEVLDNQNHQMQQWLGKYKTTRTVLDGANQKNSHLEDQIKMGRKYGQKLQRDHQELREKYEMLRKQSVQETDELRQENERLLKELKSIEDQL